MRRKKITKKRKNTYNVSPYFLRLSQARKYDVLGAIRGPDSGPLEGWLGTYSVKQFFTGRIRHIVFGRESYKATWETRPVTTLPLDLQTDLMKFPRHYLDHLRAAVQATRDHPIWGGKAEQLMDYLTVAVLGATS